MIRLGFDNSHDIRKVEVKLTDGSKVHNVFIKSDRNITFHCVDEQCADNLINVINHSVVEVSVD